MTPTPTPTKTLASHLLGVDVLSWIAARRVYENRRPWRVIAEELKTKTDGQVVVTGEALRLWMAELETETVA